MSSDNTAVHDLKLVISGPDSPKVVALDFSSLGFNSNVAAALKRAFAASLGHTAQSTKRGAFRALASLRKCLDEHGLQNVSMLPANSIVLFRSWLVARGGGATARHTLNTVLGLISWCLRNTSGAVDPKTSFVVASIPFPPPRPKRVLSRNELKAILRACYVAIDEVESELCRGRRLLNGECPEEDGRRWERMREWIGKRQGNLPGWQCVGRLGQSFISRITDGGGRRALNRMLALSPEGLLPFYVAILIQTSGNPDSILKLGRDCVGRHPLRDDLERIVWMKRRSAAEQYVDFPVGRKRSAPSLIRRLTACNEPLLELCDPEDRSRLFICRGTHGLVGLPTASRLHQLREEFIELNGLPAFDFRDLRRAGAVEHHLAGGTMETARRRLNHRSLSTTAIYTNTSDRAEHHERAIRRFQGELVRASLDAGDALVDASNRDHSSLAVAEAETVFGFRCRNPFSGIAKGSRAGELCVQFAKCATCPGALIPLDDPAVVMRLMSASIALEGARERAIREGWWQRYAALYEISRRVLAVEILPAIDDDIKAAALERAETQSIPWLE